MNQPRSYCSHLVKQGKAGSRKPIRSFMKFQVFVGLIGHLYNPHIYLRTGSPRACKVCGCTWYEACPGGCAWADEEMTLCSNCI